LKHLKETLGSPAYASRTRYDRTIANIEECFKPSDVHFGLYETMFEVSELDRLSDFVGLPSAGDLIGERVNVSPKSGEMTTEMLSEIKQVYADVYAFCNDRFPKTKEVWR
jgi:hypothetical protein